MSWGHGERGKKTLVKLVEREEGIMDEIRE